MLVGWQTKTSVSGLAGRFVNCGSREDGRRITWPFTPDWDGRSFPTSNAVRRSRVCGHWKSWLLGSRCPFRSSCEVSRRALAPSIRRRMPRGSQDCRVQELGQIERIPLIHKCPLGGLFPPHHTAANQDRLCNGDLSPIRLRSDLPHHAAGTATAVFSAFGCRSEQIAVGVDGYVAVGMGPVAASGKVV